MQKDIPILQKNTQKALDDLESNQLKPTAPPLTTLFSQDEAPWGKDVFLSVVWSAICSFVILGQILPLGNLLFLGIQFTTFISLFPLLFTFTNGVDIFFTQEELDGAAVRLITEEGYASIKVTDIHTGERVALTERVDLLSTSTESIFSIEVNRQ